MPLPNLNRRKIPTHIKLLVNLNALPAQYHDSLHPSQISRYKNHFDINDYFAAELINVSNDTVDTLRILNQYTFERSCAKSIIRLAATVRKAFAGAERFNSILNKHKDQIVDTIQRIQHIIPVDKCAKLIGLSASTLRNWITSVRVRCSGSLINICRKVHPNQLLQTETDAMQKLIKDESMMHWPLVSVYYHALHNKFVSMSLSTWYKYAGLLNIKRFKPKSNKHYQPSLKACFPNQYWHADVTQFRTADGTLNYIYLVVDNYSKMILAWAVDTKLSAQIRTQTFKDAVKTCLSIKRCPFQ